MKVAVIGSRNAKGFSEAILREKLPVECTKIISGGAIGVDSAAERVAKRLGIFFEKIVPDYDKYGKSAPILRNTDIVKRADLVIAFWDFHSRGTAHAISECIRWRVPVRVYSLDGKTVIM